MSLGADLLTTLDSIVSSRLYRSDAPTGCAKPYAVYHIDDAEPQTHFEGENALTNYDIEIEVFDTSPTDALGASIRAAMTASALFKSMCRGYRDIYDEELKLHGVRLLFSVWQ